MEISINIKLEDGDIALLIKSIFELIKKIPQDNINIKIDPNAKPPQTPTVIEPCWDNTTHTITGVDTDITTVNPLDYNTTTAEEDVYFSDNGVSVSKIESEKKNEE